MVNDPGLTRGVAIQQYVPPNEQKTLLDVFTKNRTCEAVMKLGGLVELGEPLQNVQEGHTMMRIREASVLVLG